MMWILPFEHMTLRRLPEYHIVVKTIRVLIYSVVLKTTRVLIYSMVHELTLLST